MSGIPSYSKIQTNNVSRFKMSARPQFNFFKKMAQYYSALDYSAPLELNFLVQVKCEVFLAGRLKKVTKFIGWQFDGQIRFCIRDYYDEDP